MTVVSRAFSILELTCIVFCRDLAVQSVQFTSMDTCTSKRLSVWVYFSSSSKQDALFKPCAALGSPDDTLLYYILTKMSWSKLCHQHFTVNAKPENSTHNGKPVESTTSGAHA